MRTLEVTVVDTQEDGTKQVIKLGGIGGIICTVNAVPGMEEWEKAKAGDMTILQPACVMVGTERATVPALATVIRSCQQRIGFAGVAAAIEIASGMDTAAFLTMDDASGTFKDMGDDHG